jgi:hypothetical protein
MLFQVLTSAIYDVAAIAGLGLLLFVVYGIVGQELFGDASCSVGSMVIIIGMVIVS